MSAKFSRDHAKISIGKILQTLGWHSINTTPLEIFTDILVQYISQLARVTNDYANEFGYTEPNLDHLGLTFREMGINVTELSEYIKYVNFGPTAQPVCNYPIPKESNLNFLKPGSKEVVTRPVYIHEHLPPMTQEEVIKSEDKNDTLMTETTEEIKTEDSEIFKKPGDIPIEIKKPKVNEEGSRPTREITSVMMTTSGFISPAREGKLPEARTPNPPPIEPPLAPPPQVINPMLVSAIEMPAPPEPIIIPKRIPKNLPKIPRKIERKKKDIMKPITPKKSPNMKGLVKMKQFKGIQLNNWIPNPDIKISPIPSLLTAPPVPLPPHPQRINPVKVNKTLAAARLKTEKLNTTITPIPMKHILPNPLAERVDKLFSQPDKKKVNILKKISNVKNEKPENKYLKKEDFKVEPESPPNLIIDEPEEMINKIPNLPSDITIEPINPMTIIRSPKLEPHFFDDSPPGTPSTPKTPEMIAPSPPLVIAKEKRKRKEKPRVRKLKVPKHQQLPAHIFGDLDIIGDRPKTPEVPMSALPPIKQEIPQVMPMKQEFPPFSSPYNLPQNLQFLANFGGPGLIPPPLVNPLFPTLPFAPNLPFPTSLPDFGQNPFLNRPLPLPNPLAFLIPPKEEPPEVNITELPKTPEPSASPLAKLEKKMKEHKKDKKDKLKKKNKKDKLKNKAEKAEKKKLKEEKREKLKKEKREKRKEKEREMNKIREGEITVPKLTLKLGSSSPRPETPERKLNIKPIVKKEEDTSYLSPEDSEMTPSLAKISAFVTGPPKPKPQVIPPPATPEPPTSSNDNFPTISHTKKKIKPIPKLRTKDIKKEPTIIDVVPPALPSKYVDSEGNEVWICPACGRQDDGSPMIGCDGCDAWYHWVCVGIQVPPDQNEDWYCKQCLMKKNEDLQSDKKKKRKKRERKERNTTGV